ncbi:MAG TPA: type II secretion system protein [Pyrinomonadaceae bacterium]|nr:type II secretion system protein [Pyrinomonadaceae bacterium]
MREHTVERARGDGGRPRRRGEAGFSLVELLIAMGVTLLILCVASTLLAQSFGVRMREDRRSDSLADVQRAINLMSREVANSGMALPSPLTYTPAGTSTPTSVPANGLLPAYCDTDDLSFVTNLDSHTTGDNSVSGTDEQIHYSFFTDGTDSFLVRQDLRDGSTSVLANRIDSVQFVYGNRASVGSAIVWGGAASANTVAVRILVTVNLPAVGSPGAPGYHPEWQTQLSSEVVLRNAMLDAF